MSITLFLGLFTLGSTVSSLLTEALKKALKISTNLIALIDAVIVGVFGTSAAYILLGVDWTAQNITCLILMTFCIWMGSMIGYDKVLQTIAQIKR